MKKKYIKGPDEPSSGLLMKMEKLLVLLLFVFFGVSNVQGQVTVSGAVTGNGSYTTLGAAFTAIGISQTGANINIAITGNTTETGIAALGAGDWSSVMISPSGGAWTISGSMASELIQLNGADNVTINGLNAGGNGLTISNTNATATAGTIKFQADASNNTITNCTVLGSTTVLVIPNTNAGGVIFFGTGTTTGNDGNTISNCKITAAGANLPSKLIGSIGSTTSAAIANSGNTITNCELYDFFNGAYSAAIYISTGNTDWTVTNNKMYQTVPRTFTATGILYGIVFNSPTYGENVQIIGNTLGYTDNAGSGTLTLNGSGVAGEVQGVYFNSNPTAANASNINNNTFANISLASNTGRFFGIYNGGNATSNTVNINGNGIRNIATTTTTGIVNPIFAGKASVLNCNNNIIDNISRTGVGTLYGINYDAATNVTVNGNSITNLISTFTSGTTTIAGIFSNVASVTETVNGNTITGLTSSSTGSHTIHGISTGTGTGIKTIQNNTLTNISVPASATGVIHGIKLSGGNAAHAISGNTIGSISGPNSGAGNGTIGISMSAGTTIDVYKNKVYGLTGQGAASGVIGFAITGGGTYNVYNNIIGDLTAPIATDAGGEPHIVIGINSWGMPMNFYNNTIVLNGSNSGTNFGSSALYTGGPLTLRNNILINNLPSRGTGVSVVLRLAGGMSPYNAASNNNLLAGTNIQTKTGLTDLDATLAAFKIRATGRDVLSVTETPTFVSTLGSDATYLHINTTVPTQIESGGAPIASVTTDFDGEARHASTPDIGADEFTGVANDLLGPVITHTPNLTCVPGSRTISATITDLSGVPTAGAGVPVAYWRINTGAYTAAVGTSAGSGVYDFTIGAGSVVGDVVNYYFVAQDMATTPNVSAYPSLGAAGFSVNPPMATTPPTVPGSLSIPMTGIYTVGVGGNYTTLTGAVADYNVRCLAGAVTFKLIDPTYPSETYPISIQQNVDASSVNNLTIKPAPGVAVAISGNAAELIQFNGADYVTVDGLNTGGSELTISNASTSSAANSSTLRFMADATNNTITNCTVLGSNTTNVSTAGGVIYFGTGTTTGNDSNTISNCDIGPVGTNLPGKLIFSLGTNTSEALCNSEIIITGCNLYDFFIANNYSAAIYASIGSSAWTIANNKVYQTGLRTFTSGYNMYGIYFSNSVYGNNVRITGNTIGYNSRSGSGNLDIAGNVSGGFTGIYNLTAAGASSPCNISDNTISNITLTSTSSGTIYGINNAMTTGTTNTVNIERNTIKNISTTGNTGNFYGIFGGTAFTLNCNNNRIENLSRTGAGILYGINYTQCTNATFDTNVITNLNSTSTTSTSNYTAIYTSVASGTETFTNNTISNLSSSSTSSQAINGIYCSVASTGNRTFRNNTIRNFTLAPTGTGQLYGIRMTLGGPLNEISGNTIHTFTGGSTINGINIGGGTTNNVYQNKIYGLGTSTASTAVYGIGLSGGTTHNVYNNIIGDLTATAGHLASGVANQVIGINNSAGTLNLYNNTIKLAATSTGVNFGSSAVSVAATPALTMRNNILVNTSVANGTGLSVAFRKPGLGTYDNASNNNLFYGTAIYTDSAGATDMTLNDFRTRVVNRDLLSVTENPNFASLLGSDPAYLHINAAMATQVADAGANVAMVTNDFDGEARSATTPDIGADEFVSGCAAALGGNSTPLTATICTSGGTVISVNGHSVGLGITYQWESSSDAAFTTPVNEGAATTTYANLTTPTITATTYYRLKVTCSAGMSSYSSVSTVTVTTTAQPTASAQTFCAGSTVGDLAATGTGIQWYAGSTGGSALSSTTALSNGTYYATQTISGCESPRLAVAVTVNTTAQPAASAQTFCAAATVADLAATGTGIQWYAGSTGGSALSSTTALSTTTYYVTQTISGCESPRLPVAVTVNTTAQPTASAQTFCAAATVADLAATGTGVQWYAGSTGGSALSSTTALATGTYYATQTISGCESPRLAVTVTVNVVGAPTGSSTQPISVPVLSDATIEDLVATGSNIVWYPTAADALAGTNAIPAGTQLVNGTVYYAMQTVGGCRSTSYLAVTVTVTLGVNDFALGNLKLYPNPVTAILNIENTQTISNVEVFSITGQRVMVKTINAMSASIDMSPLAGGTYLVKVVADDAVKAIKVIKN